MSGKSIETCYICSEHSPRSSCYNIQIGYSTYYCCTIECSTVVNSYFYARNFYLNACNHYKHHHKQSPIEYIEKVVDHYCYSNRCRASDYNLNVSLIKRVCSYYYNVLDKKEIHDFNYLKSLFNYCVGDEFSHDDPFDSDFEDEFLP